MSGQRKDAIALLEQIPEEKVTFILQILQGIKSSYTRDDMAEKDAAYERLEKMRKQVDIDLDPRSELAEYRDERYGYEGVDRY